MVTVMGGLSQAEAALTDLAAGLGVRLTPRWSPHPLQDPHSGTLLGFRSKFPEQVLATGHRRAVQTSGTAQESPTAPRRPLRAAHIIAW